jgi:hypothetical protein
MNHYSQDLKDLLADGELAGQEKDMYWQLCDNETSPTYAAFYAAYAVVCGIINIACKRTHYAFIELDYAVTLWTQGKFTDHTELKADDRLSFTVGQIQSYYAKVRKRHVAHDHAAILVDDYHTLCARHAKRNAPYGDDTANWPTDSIIAFTRDLEALADAQYWYPTLVS